MLKLFVFMAIFVSLSFTSIEVHAVDLTGTTVKMALTLEASRPSGGGWALVNTADGLIFTTNPNSCSFGPQGGGCTRMAAPAIKTEIIIISQNETLGFHFAKLKNVPGFRLKIEGPSYHLGNASLIKWDEEKQVGTELYPLVPSVRFVPVRN